MWVVSIWASRGSGVFNLESHTSGKLLHMSDPQVTWKEHSSPCRSRRLETTEDVTWMVTELGQKQSELGQEPHDMWGEEGSWLDVGRRVCMCMSHLSALQEQQPGKQSPARGQAGAAQLYGIHAALQTPAWKLWVRKVPVVCFCCIQRNKILSTCFVNKPKTFLTPIINFSS